MHLIYFTFFGDGKLFILVCVRVGAGYNDHDPIPPLITDSTILQSIIYANLFHQKGVSFLVRTVSFGLIVK